MDQANQDTEKIYKESKDERLLFDTKITQRESILKDWTLKLFEDNYDEFSRLLNAKSIEQENKTKTLIAEIKKQEGDSSTNKELMTMTAKE